MSSLDPSRPSEIEKKTSARPRKKRHTGEMALRRLFPDNCVALHRTQGVLYLVHDNLSSSTPTSLSSAASAVPSGTGLNFPRVPGPVLPPPSAVSSTSANSLSSSSSPPSSTTPIPTSKATNSNPMKREPNISSLGEMIKLKRSVLEWQRLPDSLVAAGLARLLQGCLAVGCAAAGAVLNRVDPTRAFVVVRTAELGKGQWKIIALYSPEDGSLVFHGPALYEEVKKVVASEAQTRREVLAKKRANTFSVPSTDGTSKLSLDNPRSHSVSNSHIEGGIGGKNDNSGRLFISGTTGHGSVKQESGSAVAGVDVYRLPILPPRTDSAGAGIPTVSPSAASAVGTSNINRTSHGIGNMHQQPLSLHSPVSSESPVTPLDASFSVLGLGDGPSSSSRSQKDGDNALVPTTTTIDTGHRGSDKDSAGAKLQIPRLTLSKPPESEMQIGTPSGNGGCGNLDLGVSLMAGSPASPMSMTIFGLFSPAQSVLSPPGSPPFSISSGNTSPRSVEHSIQDTSFKAQSSQLFVPSLQQQPLPHLSPSSSSQQQQQQQQQQQGDGMSLPSFMSDKDVVLSPNGEGQMPLVSGMSHVPSSTLSSLVVTNESPLQRQRQRTGTPRDDLFSPRAMHLPADGRMPLFDRYRAYANAAWNSQFGQLDAVPWLTFCEFIHAGFQAHDSLDPLVDFFCERQASPMALRQRWVIFVLLFHTQSFVNDPRPYLSITEAKRNTFSECFHGVKNRTLADTMLRSASGQKSCYLFRTSETSSGFLVLSRKNSSIHGSNFWHTLYGHHRPGENVVVSTSGRVSAAQDVPLSSSADIASDFYYDPSDPLRLRFHSLAEIVAHRSAAEGFQYTPIVHGSGYVSEGSDSDF